MNSHCGAEDTKDNVDFPFDVYKGRGNKVGEGKVEDPVCRRGDGDCFAADAEGEDFRRVDPRGRTPGRGVAGDEEVGASDDGVGGRAADFPRFFGDVVDATGRGGMAVAGHQAGVGKHPDGHEDGAKDEHGAAAPAVHEDEGGDRHDDVDHVLDTGVGISIEEICGGGRRWIGVTDLEAMRLMLPLRPAMPKT